jgi:hypothetical protein
MIIKEYKIPEGSESFVDAMVARCVEDFIAQQMREKPIEEKPEYQTAVDSFRVENGMEKKFEKVKEELVRRY